MPADTRLGTKTSLPTMPADKANMIITPLHRSCRKCTMQKITTLYCQIHKENYIKQVIKKQWI